MIQESFHAIDKQQMKQELIIKNSIDDEPELKFSHQPSRDSLNKWQPIQTKRDSSNFIERFLEILSMVLVVITFPLSMLCIFVLVRQFERVVILRNGKLYKNRAFGPGLICYLPCIDVIKYTDLRTICHTVPPQEALTKDSVTVSVDAVVFYKVCNPMWAVIKVADYKRSTQFLVETTLRNALGTRNLSDLLVNRTDVDLQIFQLMRNSTQEWGIHIVRIEIKDIMLPLQLQKAMAAEAESSRLTNAKISVAKAEIDCSKSLEKAAQLLVDNPLCIQLRYLQTLQMIAGPKTHTIIFPFSKDILKKIFK